MTRHLKPPVVAERLLGLCLPRGLRGRSVLGDLTLDYNKLAAQSRARAVRWYWWQVVIIGVPYLVTRMRTSLTLRLRKPRDKTRTVSPSNMRLIGVAFNDWIKDLRFAITSLRRAPSFAAVTVLTLTLALGATTSIFSVVSTVLLDPLPFPDADRLVSIHASASGSDFPEEFGTSSEFYVQYSEQASLLEDISTHNDFTATLRVGDRTERVRMSAGTPSLFTTLGVTPLLGRLPVAEDDNQVAVISHALWTTWFGNDPNVIGQTFEMAGGRRTVVGIMGPEFWFPSDGVLLWITSPMRADRVRIGNFGNSLVARVQPDVQPDALVEQLRGLAARLPERFGRSANYIRLIEQHRPVVRSLEEELLGSVSGPLWVLFGAMGVVLLIACANVANLFMVRFESRQRDMAVRQAIGATRGQLISSQMAEAVVVAMLAGALAVFVAWAGVSVLVSAAPIDIPRLSNVDISGSTVLFTITASLLCAMLFRLVPAIRSSAPNLARLRDGGRGTTRRRHLGRDILVITQTAMALVLMIGSGLLVRSFVALRNVDPGYDTNNIFTFQIAPEGDNLRDGPSYAQFHMNFMDRIASLPGVESVGVVENVPLNEGVNQMRFRTEEAAADTEGGSLLGVTFTAGNYFRTMGIDVLGGRTFQRTDHVSQPGNVIISESAANLLWPNLDPIGRRIQRPGIETWETVVGVVEDVLQDDFRHAPNPLVYFPLVGPSPTDWVISSPAYVVKTTRAEFIAPDIRGLVREVAPNAPMYRAYTMAGLAADSMSGLTFTALTLGMASVLALILGAIGLYGVLSYIVTERIPEIGVRMALGAKATGVQRMVVAQGVRVALVGVAIGIVSALAATRALSGLLFGVEAVDLRTFVGMSALMLLVGLVASYLPARRASSVDPIESLKGG